MQTRLLGKPLVSPLPDPEKLFSRRFKFSEKVSSSNIKQMAEGGGDDEVNIDPFDTPMINKTREVVRTPGSAIIAPNMGNDFSVKGHHLKMIQDSAFDGNMQSDPHKHISAFTELCKMFRYGDGLEDGVKLSLFPSSLTGEARTWFNELEPESIRTWEQLREAFVNRFFPPALARKLLNQIRSFRQHDNETITEAWIRLKELLRNCHGHGLDKEQHIDIFYEGLIHKSQHDLDLAGGGNFLYKSTNEAYRMMEDQVLASIARNRVNKDRRMRDMVAHVETGNSGEGMGSNSEIVEELKSLSQRFDKRMGSLEKDVHLVRNGCEVCGGPHYTSECDRQGYDANYVYGQYKDQGDYNRGNFNQGRNERDKYGGGQVGNFSRQHNQYQPQRSEGKREEEDPELKEMMKTFIHTQNAKNEGISNSIKVLTDRVEQNQRNQQASMQDLERRFDRLSSRFENRPTGQIPSNTQPNPKQNNFNNQSGPSSQGPRYQTPNQRNESVNAIYTRSGFSYGGEKEQNEKQPDLGITASHPPSLRRSEGSGYFPSFVDQTSATQSSPVRRSEVPDPENDPEAELEVENQVGNDPIVQSKVEEMKTSVNTPLKAYKPKIPYPQQLRKEKMKAQYGKFLDLIKTVHVNVPLVDVIAGMPNYDKFIKELVSKKGKSMEEQAAYLNTECSEIVKNGKLPPKLTDPGSFLLTCTFGKTFHYNALADLGASINLMPYSLYKKLALGVLKPTKMSVKLADQTFQYPLGIVENMLVQVGRFVFPVDFVILEMEEDRKVPLILGRPFLNTADAIIRVKKKEISLGVGDDRETFAYFKSKKHSYSTDETCFKIEVVDNDMCELELQDFLDDDSDDVFNELDDLIMNADLEKLEDEKKDVEEEIRELLGDETGVGAEWFGIDVDEVTSDNLEDLLNVVDDPGPNEERLKERVDEKEMGRKSPEWSEVQGIQDFIDKLISYLTCRKDDSFGKFGTESFRVMEGRCKNVCIYVGYVRMVIVIVANTREWNDARVKFFEKYLVSMETCDLDNVCLCFIFDTMI